MKGKRNLKVGDGLSPSAVRERWTRRAACIAGLAAVAGGGAPAPRGAPRTAPGPAGTHAARPEGPRRWVPAAVFVKRSVQADAFFPTRFSHQGCVANPLDRKE